MVVVTCTVFNFFCFWPGAVAARICAADAEPVGEVVAAAGGAGGESGCRQRFCPRFTTGTPGGATSSSSDRAARMA